jgi:hypothetical protein
MGIQDQRSGILLTLDSRSGMGKIILDKHPESATLHI